MVENSKDQEFMLKKKKKIKQDILHCRNKSK